MDRDTFWRGLGHGVGAGISSLPGTSTLPRPARSRGQRPHGRSAEAQGESGDPLSRILVGAVSGLAVSVLKGWSKASRPSLQGLARGALAGAGAAGVVFFYRLLKSRTSEGPSSDETGERVVSPSPALPDELLDELLAGAGRGLIYAALLEPLLPGPPPLRGALAGTLDYLAMPLGGLFSGLQTLSPVRRVPVISILLETGDAEDEPYLSFLAYGLLMGLIYGEGDRA